MSNQTLHAATFATPCGPFSVAVNDTGAVVATAFGKLARLRDRLPKNTRLAAAPTSLTAAVEKQLTAYFAGKRRTFDLPLAAHGTEFQHRVWTALAAIPFGETRSYGRLAADIGKPGAARAIGRANATNPICLLVPCHRVIGADGSLTGFAFGETIKRQLLTHEGIRIG
ncbi:MAG TPA: methylated-DNA--[protein]-cysteine S-methyltransferase [Rariglobus sp.]|jgi:methylated-DNA-[protein]-cysteine S-methyltransferase|nr:methylated-DNA--[protein]-cysteine S-methyltransferase [Rariglobus sp.]